MSTDQQKTGLRETFENYRGYLVPFIILVVFGFTTFAIYDLTTEVSYDDVLAALAATKASSILLAIFFTALSFVALTGYDLNALSYIGKKLPPVPVAMTAFSAYAVGNTAGFGALSGGAIRFRGYSRLGLSPDDIGRVIAFVTLAFGIGLLGVTAIASLVTAPRIGSLLGIGEGWVRGIAVAIIVVLSALVVAGWNGREVALGRLKLRLPDTKTS